MLRRSDDAAELRGVSEQRLSSPLGFLQWQGIDLVRQLGFQLLLPALELDILWLLSLVFVPANEGIPQRR
jgi:hypothetical protein